ncbi:MAG: serine/threonine-protein kinase [Nannocystaceae bacterium]
MAAPEDTPAGVPPPGTVLGRYVVDTLIGRGAMGVVVRAYDPELDRTVALKLLADGGTGLHAGARARLLREAQAMARLSHPNIVRVHDVGVVDEQAFVAFERIDGGTLRSWWHTGRTLAEILATYAAAGRGLAAAHEAGLVHRDFKPDNVLIDRNGGVFVTDFGLVRVGPPTRPSVSRAMAALPQLDDADVTVAGAIVGTPAYMAPEQLEGGEVDERSDQFSFCVALYEAVYGTRPFVGTTVDRLASAVMREQFAPVPAGRRVPGWLRGLLRKGLRRYPGERFASMHALLHELAAAPRRRRVATVAIATMAAGALAIALGSWSRSRPCRALERDDAARVAAIAAELAAPRASDDPLLRDAATAASAWQQRWSAAREQACRASFERGERSREGFTAVDACLEAAHAELVALGEQLRAPPSSPQRARVAAAAARLPDPHACRRRLAAAEDDATASSAALRVLASLAIAPTPDGSPPADAALPEAALAQARAEPAPQADAALHRALIEGERRRRLGVVARAWVARAQLLLHGGGDGAELDADGARRPCRHRSRRRRRDVARRRRCGPRRGAAARAAARRSARARRARAATSRERVAGRRSRAGRSRVAARVDPPRSRRARARAGRAPAGAGDRAGAPGPGSSRGRGGAVVGRGRARGDRGRGRCGRAPSPGRGRADGAPAGGARMNDASRCGRAHASVATCWCGRWAAAARAGSRSIPRRSAACRSSSNRPAPRGPNTSRPRGRSRGCGTPA